MKIPISRPLFGPEEFAAVQRPLQTGWVVQGPFVKEFEEKFSRFTGAPHAAATTSCTTALQLAAVALGLKPGDEVLVPAFTWVATANAVEYCGAKPVFVDIDLTTYNVDPEALQSAWTPRTVGIMPVHLFGLPAQMDRIVAFAHERDLWIVEDAACSMGGWYRGKHTGTIGDAGCFSFHPRKSITTGEGGMVTTRWPEIDTLVRSLRDHGATRSDLARHTSANSFLLAEYDQVGYNYRMTDLQGAIGSAQMDRAEGILKERARLASRYDELLADLVWLERPQTPSGMTHGWQSYVCLFAPERPTLVNVDRLHGMRNAVMARLEERGIATRQGTHAAALQGFYARTYGIRPDHVPNAHLAEKLTISLPLFAGLTAEEQDSVAKELRGAYEEVA